MAWTGLEFAQMHEDHISRSSLINGTCLQYGNVDITNVNETLKDDYIITINK